MLNYSVKSTRFDVKRVVILYLVGTLVFTLPLLFLSILTISQFAAILSVFIIILAVIDPRWGIASMIASLAMMEVLPDLPLVSSFSALLGVVTFASFFLYTFVRKILPLPKKLEGGFWLALLLVAWIFFTHPDAALVLGDRVWIWTFVQLVLAAWLARHLITDLSTTRLVAILFVLANLLSVYIVFQQGHIGDSLYQSQRGYGLGLGSNGTARYLILALLFTYYLYITDQHKKPIYSLLYMVCAAILTLGVIYTVSRTGIILIPIAAGLILISPSAKGNGKKLGFLLLGGVGISFFIPENAFSLVESIVPSILGGTDTAGLRYALWAAGMKMFSTSPVTGVGIGQFQYLLPKYGAGIVPAFFLNLTSHSTYVQLLAETGIIGFALFLAMAGLALKNLYSLTFNQDHHRAMTAWLWFSLIIVILVGAFTKTDFTEKLLWVALGVGYAAKSLLNRSDES